MRRLALSALALLCLVAAAAAQAPAPETAAERALFPRVFPAATRFGAVEGAPPAAPAYRDDALVGYVFSTRAVVESRGFSGKPLNVVVGLGLDARIAGAAIAEHHEPILEIGVADQDLVDFVAQYVGRDVRDPVQVARWTQAGDGAVDAVSGATISSVVINDAILRGARAVARSRGLLGGAGVDFDSFAPADWPALLAEGSLVRLRVGAAEAAAAVERAGGRLFPPGAEPGDPDAAFLELYSGLATPARVGRNLLGDRLYNRVMAEIAAGDQLLFLGGRGLYSFKGTGFVRSGVFDRLQLVQGDTTIRFETQDHVRIDELAVTGAPELCELAVFVIRAATGFSPVLPWRVEVLVAGAGAEGPALATFARSYTLPARYLEQAPAEAEPPLWTQMWQRRAFDVAVLAIALTGLTGMLVFQDAIARRRRRYDAVRLGFLTFTLLWLGWYAGAQLSVLNVLTFAEAVRSEFRWDFFLLEPLLFILWSYVAVALLFWGRGVFCGWLCPFGALQELTNRIARWARVPQWRVPFALHERLWPVKYVVFLALLALSLHDMSLAQTGAEAEPFKTAVVLKFDRPWPFVVYPLALLVAGLFVQRPFCRYLCPLGAALAIPARLRMFDWLKRRWQCGTQCHQCAVHCPVQAIHPDGRINPNECVYCLDCQVLYHDDHVCPPLIARRQRREHRATGEARRQAAPAAPDAGDGP